MDSSSKKVGYDLTGVPRNGETEFLFRTAAKMGEPDFLDMDEIFAESAAFEFSEYRCPEKELMNVYGRCISGIERYIQINGLDAAVRHYFNMELGSCFFYPLARRMAYQASQFCSQAQDIIAKYRPACRRVEKPLPDVLIGNQPVKAAETRAICAIPNSSVEKTDQCAEMLAKNFTASNKGFKVTDARYTTLPADITPYTCGGEE